MFYYTEPVQLREPDCGRVIATVDEKLDDLAPLAADDQAITIVFDLVHPIEPGWRLGSRVGMQGGTKPAGVQPLITTLPVGQYVRELPQGSEFGLTAVSDLPEV